MKGEVIGGRFLLRELVGRGGMSEVWLAEDRELGRPVALKLLAGGADPARLVREARAIATLSHPNIAGVYDVGETEGRPYLVLEYLPGGTLEDRLREGRPLPDWQTEQVAREIAAGLAHAHAAGIVHRDLKPSNVLFDAEGRAKIADFGIARAAGQVTLTEAGTVMGTAAYLAPEQAGGEPAGPPADVYAFGVILFRLLTGALPFTGDTPLQVALKHRSERPPSIRSLRSDAPVGLAALAERALAKSPEARPADGSRLLALLEDPALAGMPGAPTAATVFLPPEAGGETVVMRRPPPPRRSRTKTRRLVLALLLLGLLVAAGVLAAFLVSGSDQPTATLPTKTTSSVRTTTEVTTAPAPTEPTTTAETTTETAPTTQPDTGTTAPATETAPTTAPTTDTTATTGP